VPIEQAVSGMQPGNWRRRVKTVGLFIASFAIGVIILFAFVGFVGFTEIATLIRSTPLTILGAALGLNLLSLFLYGLAWYTLIRSLGGRIRFSTCQGIALTGIFMYFATPSGIFLEAVRVVLSSKESNMNYGGSTATVVVHRILFTVGFISAATLATASLVYEQAISTSLLLKLGAVLAGSLVVLVLIVYLVLRINKIEKLAHRFLPRLESAIRRVSGGEGSASPDQLLRSFVSDFDQGLRTILRKRLLLLLSFGLVLAYWLCTVAIMYVVFAGLNHEVSIWIVILTIAIAEFIQFTPVIVPGMLGVLESILTGVLGAFGVPIGVAASATILVRVSTYWFNLPVTGSAAIYYGSKYAVRRIVRSAYE
jgi:uncharacterized protein (TIRG00374 family)